MENAVRHGVQLKTRHRALVCWVGSLLLVSLSHSLPGLAHDLIRHRDTTRVEALALEVKGSQIFHKKWGLQNGPTSVISTAYVRYIQYRSGKRQEFPQPAFAAASALPDPVLGRPVNRGRTVVSIRLGDLIFKNATVTYERLLGADSQVGGKVPLTVGFGHPSPLNRRNNHYQTYKTFSTGLEFNFYSGLKGRFRYFVGPALQYGQFRYRYAEQYADVYFLWWYLWKGYGNYQEATGQHFAFLINNGIWYQLGKRFVFSADSGVGLQMKVLDATRKNLDTEDLEGGRFKVSGNFNLGYQF